LRGAISADATAQEAGKTDDAKNNHRDQQREADPYADYQRHDGY
jgi:hypothetical protein